ncbi:S8 family serine peptidase [Desmospora profundinema]|uniref:Minor extracellular serine protease Vpr n=1 Tax=Desmospora profundinema TaxID=1571184 RepID=A0ABU1ISZ2_9BACL|nr:S8 family serine peptidase [Desmospora profundinema]MDR6227319.1 minor extracellular serine protease Vpr [Desmospora profundinema]
MSKKWRGWIVVLSFVFVLTSMVSPAQASFVDDGVNEKAQSSGEEYYFVQLEDESVASYEGDVKGFSATKVEENEQLDVAAPEVKKYQKHLKDKRSEYKSWLKKEGGSKVEVVEEYDLTLNGVAVKADGVNPKELEQGPGVEKVVKSLEYSPAMNTSHDIIQNQPLWNSGFQGEGVKVGVIDSGIEQTHPFFQDSSLPMPEGFPKGDERFTTNKVIAAKVYWPEPGVTPEAVGDHGTHVAGTIAGVRDYKDPSGAAKTPLSGVAPRAYLGNYNVFPCESCRAQSIYIAAAVEDAVRDGMDVINMSLGGTAQPGFDLLAEIVNAATDAGVTVVISAGNSGPGPMTIGSPGTADKVITVAAVTNSHFIGLPINFTLDGESKTVGAATADPGGLITEGLEAPLHVVTEGDGLGCEGISEDLTGKVAVLKRGACTFTEKAMAAQNANAVGMVLVNNAPGDPSGMFIEEEATIPSVMVSQEDGKAIEAANEASVKMEPGEIGEFNTGNEGLVALFSSRGPTVNYTLKPDVAAVGANVYSATTGGGLTSKNGTSMSAPHVAGAAALMTQARPDWTPQDIKAALIGTGVDTKDHAVPLAVGGGIIQVDDALNTPALANPASLSFGKVPNKGKDSKKTFKVTVTNTSKKAQVYRINVDDVKQVNVDKTQVRVAKGKSATFKVTVDATGKTVWNNYQGYITVTADKGEGKRIRIPYHFHVTN